jgi:hypothetical protein
MFTLSRLNLTLSHLSPKNLASVKMGLMRLAMTIFLILAPYGAFTFLMLVAPPVVSVFAASLIGLVVIARDAMRGRSLKIFGVGGTVVFAAICLYLGLVEPSLAASKVKLAVDTGIFVVAAGSMLIRFPFSLQYALEAVPAETAAMPGFLRANYLITGAWAAASLLMILSNLAVLYVPGMPIWISLLIAFAARNSALYFTKWYPQYRERKYGPEPVTVLPGTH